MKNIEIIGIESWQEHEKIPNPLIVLSVMSFDRKNGDRFYD